VVNRCEELEIDFIPMASKTRVKISRRYSKLGAEKQK